MELRQHYQRQVVERVICLYRSITCVLSLNYRIKEYEQKIAEVQKRIQLV